MKTITLAKFLEALKHCEYSVGALAPAGTTAPVQDVPSGSPAPSREGLNIPRTVLGHSFSRATELPLAWLICAPVHASKLLNSPSND